MVSGDVNPSMICNVKTPFFKNKKHTRSKRQMGFIYSSLYTSGTCAARLAKRPEVVFFYLHLCTKWTPGDESARCGQECVVIKQVKGSSRSRYPEKKHLDISISIAKLHPLAKDVGGVMWWWGDLPGHNDPVKRADRRRQPGARNYDSPTREFGDGHYRGATTGHPGAA